MRFLLKCTGFLKNLNLLNSIKQQSETFIIFRRHDSTDSEGFIKITHNSDFSSLAMKVSTQDTRSTFKTVHLPN